MGDDFWRDRFGPMLADTEAVPFGARRYAAFFVEPVQSEAGIRIPPPDHLARVGELCHRDGSLPVVDEVQTGMFRTGRFLASQGRGADPDIVVLAKALSGGLVPVSAVLITDEIYESV